MKRFDENTELLIELMGIGGYMHRLIYNIWYFLTKCDGKKNIVSLIRFLKKVM